MITGSLGEVTAEMKRMELWCMWGNRTSGALGARSFSAKNQNREQRKGFAKLAKFRPGKSADLAIGCFRGQAAEFIFRIHLSEFIFRNAGDIC
jgi:hypothetical protein